MQFSSRFTIAVHTIMCIIEFQDKEKTTSSFIAGSVNVNPVMIRRVLGQLKEAKLVNVEAGVGGASLAKDPAHITLRDVFCAVEDPDEGLFRFHEHPNPSCPVGKTVHAVLDGKLAAARQALEDSLAQTTLQDLMCDMRALAGEEARGEGRVGEEPACENQVGESRMGEDQVGESPTGKSPARKSRISGSQASEDQTRESQTRENRPRKTRVGEAHQ